MRKFLIVTLALMFVLGLSGLAMANDNEARQKVNGNHNLTLIEQVGDENEAFQRQLGPDNIAVIWQVGNSNTAEFDYDRLSEWVTWWNTQTDYDIDFHCSPCNFNTKTWMQYQWGHFNEAYIDVLGDRNNTVQWQSGTSWGDYNYADIKINGDDNDAKQVQLGDSNEAYIDVLGNTNILCQYQEGNDNFVETLIEGDNNTACVIQKNG